MNYYVAPVSEYLNDGNVQKWIESKAQLVVNDPDHLAEYKNKIKEQLQTLRPELLDATSTYSNGDPYASLIFKQNCNHITIYDKKMRSLRNLVVPLPAKFESFNGNLA